MNNNKKWWAIALLAPMVYANSLSPELKKVKNNGRDPFQAISVMPCDAKQEKLTDWQLQGVVSGMGYQSGWVRRTDGIWLKLIVGASLSANWQVSYIGSRQMNLQHINPDIGCSVLSETAVLLMR
jgi:pilus assembly protein HofP